MRILFVGDLHGRIWHLLSIIKNIVKNNEIDLAIQLGDFGYFTSTEQLDTATLRFSENDKSELHTIQYLNLDNETKRRIKGILGPIRIPIHFIQGNHDNHELLQKYRTLSKLEDDPLELLSFAPNSCVSTIDKLTIAYYGFDTPNSSTESRFTELHRNRTHGIDILCTHEGPYGIGMGFNGQMQGSKVITDLIKSLNPKYHFHGHYHTTIGPNRIGNTISHGLSILMLPIRREPEVDINPGSLGIFDTETGEFSYIISEEFSVYQRNVDATKIIETEISLNV